MSYRFLNLCPSFKTSIPSLRASMLLMAALTLSCGANAQAPAAKKATSSAATWVQTRTPDGQPDLQGVWTNTTATPFERPAALAGKSEFSADELTAARKKANDSVGDFQKTWMDPGLKGISTKQTSLVVDPPNGRVPLMPWAESTRDYNLAHVNDSWEFQTSWDRCITRGMPAGMFPGNYNNGYQVVQTPGYVTIVSEMIHNSRVIPLDGRPHLPGRVRLWDGDSRGHWEGNTLVVDTTNYNGQGNIATTDRAGRIRGVPLSEELHVVERFTRTGPDTINYQATINDPKAYSRSWTVAFPFSKADDYVLYEYACHEGNYAMPTILNGGRVTDKAKR